jgi:hypothetical protein
VLERHNVVAGRAPAVLRPRVHKFATPRQRVRSPVGLDRLAHSFMLPRTSALGG